MAVINPKQLLFAQEYLIDLNATQAAIRAGYSKRTAEWQGPQLLGKPHVAEEIQRLMDNRSARLEISADNVLQEIAKLAFHDPRKFFKDDGSLLPLSELDDVTAMSLSGIETTRRQSGDNVEIYVTKIKTADKGANLERLGRHLKLFTDKSEVDLKGKLSVQFIREDDGL